MSVVKTYQIPTAILKINADKDIIDVEPDYQRQGDIWNNEKRQLLIDSILNNYDIPKIYFHVIPDNLKKGKKQKYLFAIIDGRQRLETVWGYINGDFTLSEDFIFLQNPDLKAGGLTYADLGKKFPKLKIIFDSFVLPIVFVETDDVDLIEDMFSRLNEAVPLNAAEKRNAIGGPMVATIRKIAGHEFFKKKVKIPNNRFQHMEVAVKMLFLENSLFSNGKYIDTKKVYLDAFVRDFKQVPANASNTIGLRVTAVLDEMNRVFMNKDELLRSQGIIPIYYLFFRDEIDKRNTEKITRQSFLYFREIIIQNRSVASIDITKANFDLLNFDRLSQQGTNDAVSIRERFRIMSEQINLINTQNNFS